MDLLLKKEFIKQNINSYFKYVVSKIINVSFTIDLQKHIIIEIFSKHESEEIKIFMNDHMKIYHALFTHIINQYDDTNFEFIINKLINSIGFQAMFDIIGCDLTKPIITRTIKYLYKKYYNMRGDNLDISFNFKNTKINHDNKDEHDIIIKNLHTLVSISQYSSNLYNVIPVYIKRVFEVSGWNDPMALPLINHFGKTLENTLEKTFNVLSLQSFVHENDNKSGLNNPSLFQYIITNFKISNERWGSLPAPGLVCYTDLIYILKHINFNPDLWECAIKKYHISQYINRQITFYRNVGLIFKEFQVRKLKLKHVNVKAKNIFTIPDELVLQAWNNPSTYSTSITEEIKLFNEMLEIYLEIADNTKFDIYVKDGNYRLDLLVSNLFNIKNYTKIIEKYGYINNTFISQELEFIKNNLHNLDEKSIIEKITPLIYDNDQIMNSFLNNLEKFVNVIPKFGNWFYLFIIKLDYKTIMSINVKQIKSPLLFKSLFLGIFQKYINDHNMKKNIVDPIHFIKYLSMIRTIGFGISIKKPELLHIITIINNFINRVNKDFDDIKLNNIMDTDILCSGINDTITVLKSWDLYIMSMGIDNTAEFADYIESIIKVLMYMYDKTKCFPVYTFDCVLESKSLKDIINTFRESVNTNNIDVNDTVVNDTDVNIILKKHYQYLIEKANSDKESSKCLICLTNPREWLFEGCSHITSCSQCLDKMLEKPDTSKCPTCRHIILKKHCRRVYIT
jgi:hypothetical protein